MSNLSVVRGCAFAALSCFIVSANAKVGTVAFVIGEANLAKTPTKQLAKKDPVDNGDKVITGSNGRVQLRMIDGGKIAIRPGSEFLIEEYDVTAAATESALVAVASKDKNAAVLNLLKGGFRTITGDAAERNPQEYRVKTPVATMGIRGTHYQVRLCTASCQSELTSGENDSYRGAGLYVGVYEGVVWVESGGAEIEIAPGEFVWVASSNEPPQLLTKPSKVLQDPLPPPPPPPSGSEQQESQRIEGQNEAADSGEGRANNSEQPQNKQGQSTSRQAISDENLRRRPDTEPQPSGPGSSPGNGDVAGPDRQLTAEGGNVDVITGGSDNPVFERSITWGFGPNAVNGEATTTVEAINNNFQSTTDSNGALVRFQGALQTAAGPQNAEFDIGTASVVNTGQDVDTGLRWGRWSGGVADVTVAGNTTGQNLQNQSLHWIHSPLTDQATALPQTGTADYQLVGNTNPTDNAGEVGFLGSATLQADFTAQTVTNSVNLGIAGENWQATGSASLTNPQFSGQYNNVTVNGNATGNGQFSGFFLPPDSAAQGAPPAGAGLSFSLNDPNNPRATGGVSVSGTAAFADPQ